MWPIEECMSHCNPKKKEKQLNFMMPCQFQKDHIKSQISRNRKYIHSLNNNNKRKKTIKMSHNMVMFQAWLVATVQGGKEAAVSQLKGKIPLTPKGQDQNTKTREREGLPGQRRGVCVCGVLCLIYVPFVVLTT